MAGKDKPRGNLTVAPRAPSIKTKPSYTGHYTRGTKTRYASGPGKAKEAGPHPGYLFGKHD